MYKKTAFTLCILFVVRVLAQAPLHYNLKAKHGFKTETVYALFQDANKHIWMGTEDGLIEFDGKHFKTYFNSL